MFFRPTFCQTGNNIVGLYQCVEDEMNLLTREHRYFVKFFEITQINSDSISIWPIVNNSVIAKLKGDSLFFIYDYTNIYNFNTHAEGKGSFFPDSINFSYYESQTGYEAFYMVESGHKLPTGLNDLVSPIRLKCFPNPFIDNITLSYEIPNSIKGAAFNLYSVTGQLLKSIEITERGQFTKTFNLKELNSGIYIGVVTFNNKAIKAIRLFKE
jgi:hypothetical protein